jgi:hypothetical protein
MEIERIKKAVQLIHEADALLAHGPLTWYVEEWVACYDFLMERFAPFKVGDRVRLTKAPDIGPDSGWNGSRHFLIPGALGVVADAECGRRFINGSLSDKAAFRFGVQFDDESWIDRNGTVHPIDKDRHVYTLGESFLEKVAHE